jgi:hypothetical protein
LDNTPEQSNGAESGGVRAAKAFAIVIAVTAFTLLFIPNSFLGMQIRTDFHGGKFVCGGEAIEV